MAKHGSGFKRRGFTELIHMPFCHKGDKGRSGDVSDWNVCHITHVDTIYVFFLVQKLKSLTELKHGDTSPKSSPWEIDVKGSGIQAQPWQHGKFEGKIGCMRFSPSYDEHVLHRSTLSYSHCKLANSVLSQSYLP